MPIVKTFAPADISEALAAVRDLQIFYEKRLRSTRLEGSVGKFKSKLISFAEGQKIRIQNRVRKAWHKKFEQTEIDDLDFLALDFDEENIMLADILTPFYEDGGNIGRKEALRQLEQMLQRKIVYRGSIAWVRDNAIRFGEYYSQIINETTNELIRDAIAEAIQTGEAVDWLMDKIAEVTVGRMRDYRAEMTGRTELGRAYNMSALIQDARLGIEDFDWDGCNPDCEICAPFMDASPHSAEEIEAFIFETHPNCVGTQIPVVPENFEAEVD